MSVFQTVLQSVHYKHSKRVQFLNGAKIALLLIVIWIITLLLKEVNYVNTFNELYRNADLSLSAYISNDDELFLDVSQTGELPTQRTLTFSISDGIKSGDQVVNCGLSVACDDNEFAVHLFTGKDNQLYPKLCIDGKYILDKGLNSCGRGINVAIIDNMTRSVLRVSNFDTYEKDSQPLEELLLTLRVGDIIVMITFDEPTSKLSQIARLLLHEMGSNWAQNLQYRSSWYIITQKGIHGYTPYENINLPGNSGWAASHDIRTCVPLQIKGLTVQPDPILSANPKRAQFCSKYLNEYPLFCEGNLVNDPLIPARILKFLPISNEIVKTPIVVLTGQSYSENIYLPLTLETIVRQPGITPKNVIVFYDSICCPSISLLADLFDFMSTELSDWDRNLEDVLKTTELLFPDAKAFIIIDLNTILAPDFIPYMGQLLPFLLMDKSDIISISAWNDNGYEDLSIDTGLVYRVNSTNYRPRFAAMFRRGFSFDMKTNFLWSFTDTPIHDNVVIPDVSRVLFLNHEKTELQTNEAQNFVLDFMQRRRAINLEDEVLLKAFELGDSLNFYEQSIKDMINKSVSVLDINHLEKLLAIRNDNSKRFFSISCESAINCRQLCSDLGLANCLPHLIIPNIGGVIKFSKRIGDTVFLVNKTYK